MFQVYSSVIHHLYIILCIHHPKLSLPSLFIPPLTSSSSLYPPSLWYHHTIVFVNEGLLTWIPASRIRCGCYIQIHINTDYRNPVEKKGAAWPLSKFERGPLTTAPLPHAWTGFYCFSGHITERVILIYYAEVHHR